ATLFMLLVGALAVELGRMSGQGEVVIGTPVAGRRRKELEGVMGLFVNTIALRLEVRGEESFGQMLRRVKEVALAGYANQDVGFEKVVKELEPERDLSHSPLYQVMFA